MALRCRVSLKKSAMPRGAIANAQPISNAGSQRGDRVQGSRRAYLAKWARLRLPIESLGPAYRTEGSLGGGLLASGARDRPSSQALANYLSNHGVGRVANRFLPQRRFRSSAMAESLDRRWTYRYEGVAMRYPNQWIDQLRWQRLKPFQKLAEMPLGHLEGRLNATSC